MRAGAHKNTPIFAGGITKFLFCRARGLKRCVLISASSPIKSRGWRICSRGSRMSRPHLNVAVNDGVWPTKGRAWRRTAGSTKARGDVVVSKDSNLDITDDGSSWCLSDRQAVVNRPLLRMIAGLETITSGDLFIGKPV